MDPGATTTGGAIAPWAAAVKPKSWPKVLVPALLGQALGALESPGASVLGAAVGLTFSVLDLLAVVLLNDWGDREIDARKRRMFPEAGSPKTIPDGLLSANAVLLAGLGAAAGALLVAVLGGLALGRPELGLLGLLALACFQAYTFAPLRLNYRGGGELLEAFGLGVLLPWVNAVAHGGLGSTAAWSLLAGYGVLSLASAIASGLADEESDRAGAKSTVTTRYGNRRARGATEACLGLGALVWLGTALGAIGTVVGGAALAGALVVLLHVDGVRASSAAAVTRAFAAQAVFKTRLHDAIWRGGLAAAGVLLLGAVAGLV